MNFGKNLLDTPPKFHRNLHFPAPADIRQDIQEIYGFSATRNDKTIIMISYLPSILSHMKTWRRLSAVWSPDVCLGHPSTLSNNFYPLQELLSQHSLEWLRIQRLGINFLLLHQSCSWNRRKWNFMKYDSVIPAYLLLQKLVRTSPSMHVAHLQSQKQHIH